MELLDSIATELLAAPATAPERDASNPAARQSEPPRDVPAGRDFPALAHDSGRSDAPALELPAIDSVASVQASLVPRPAVMTSSSVAPAPQAPSSKTATDAAQPAPPQLDPELLASLVNDVLVEQARRHGVDLS
jgi:hypothetical protein